MCVSVCVCVFVWKSKRMCYYCTSKSTQPIRHCADSLRLGTAGPYHILCVLWKAREGDGIWIAPPVRTVQSQAWHETAGPGGWGRNHAGQSKLVSWGVTVLVLLICYYYYKGLTTWEVSLQRWYFYETVENDSLYSQCLIVNWLPVWCWSGHSKEMASLR